MTCLSDRGLKSDEGSTVAGREPSQPCLRLTDRLRGIYRLHVNDGAGLLNGSDTFTRIFETPPIQKEAADVIETLVASLKECLDLINDEYTDAQSSALDGHHIARVARKAWDDGWAALSKAGA